MPSGVETAALLELAVVVIGGALVLVGLGLRLGLPPTLGYLLAGVALGPSASGLLPDSAEFALFAELGVVFLLFMVGLEFSLSHLFEARRIIVRIGLAEVAILAGLGAVGAILVWQLSAGAALVVGGAVAMSSTALCLKQLADQGELLDEHGRIAVGVLLFQDLATVFFLLLIGAAPGSASGTWLHVLVGFVAFATVLIPIRALARPATRWLTRQRSTELLQLAALFLALGAALMAHELGLSPAIGAFLAGMVVGESDARQHVERELKPFRDLLVGVFFISMGAQLDLAQTMSAPVSVAVWLAALVGLKLVAIALIAAAAGWPARTATRSAVVLAHGGEFGLLLISLGAAADILPDRIAQPLFLAIGLSLFLAPLMIRSSASRAEFVVRRSRF